VVFLAYVHLALFLALSLSPLSPRGLLPSPKCSEITV